MRPTLLAALAILLCLAAPAKADPPYDPDVWEKQIVAACLVLEATDQGAHGMQAVASVIANRARRDPSRYIAVVKQPYAFSSLNAATTGRTGADGFANHVRRASQDRNWPLALQIVDDLFAHQLPDNTYGADHFTRRDHLPSWSHGMRATVVIGDHLFFRAK